MIPMDLKDSSSQIEILSTANHLNRLMISMTSQKFQSVLRSLEMLLGSEANYLSDLQPAAPNLPNQRDK